jgi:hypothetical protein
MSSFCFAETKLESIEIPCGLQNHAYEIDGIEYYDQYIVHGIPISLLEMHFLDKNDGTYNVPIKVKIDAENDTWEKFGYAMLVKNNGIVNPAVTFNIDTIQYFDLESFTKSYNYKVISCIAFF